MRWQRILGLASGLLLLAAGAAWGQPQDGSQPVPKLTPAQELYARHCAACHGVAGDGRGAVAAFLYPKPRDFRTGKYRLVSTDNRVPSRADLQATLVRGMPGSSMPSWAHLSPSDRDLLVDEVIRLTTDGARDRFAKNLIEQEGLTPEDLKDPDLQAEMNEYAQRQVAPGETLALPKLPASDAASVARGKAIFLRQSCHSCHGTEGKGDGVQKMIDDEGYAMRPRDLTRGIYKGGDDIASLYRRIVNGMPGTPMPGSQNLNSDDIGDMVHFLLSLSTPEQRQAPILRRNEIRAIQVASLPADSAAGAWREAPPVNVNLTPLWWRDDAVPNVQVQALHDGNSLVLRLEWADPVANLHASGTELFKDAAAMELFGSPNAPFLGMGSLTEPIDLWMWDADRGSTGGELEAVHPRMVVDIYPFNEKVVETAEFARPGTKTSAQPDISLPAQAVGNQIVRSIPHPTGGSALAGAGPGSTTFRFPKSQLVTATGRWSQGRWTVLLRRSLKVARPEDGLSLAPGQRVSIALAIWEGSQRDRNGQKQISIWQDLVLEAR